MTEPLQLILCTCPDKVSANNIAKQLVEKRLAACVNILPNISSIYHWQGQIEEANETLLLIKAPAENYQQIEQFIKQQHPYTVPEIIALAIQQGLPEYLSWLMQSTEGVKV